MPKAGMQLGTYTNKESLVHPPAVVTYVDSVYWLISSTLRVTFLYAKVVADISLTTGTQPSLYSIQTHCWATPLSPPTTLQQNSLKAMFLAPRSILYSTLWTRTHAAVRCWTTCGQLCSTASTVATLQSPPKLPWCACWEKGKDVTLSTCRDRTTRRWSK